MLLVGVVMTTTNIFLPNGSFSIPQFFNNSCYFVLAVFSVLGLCVICLNMVSVINNQLLIINYKNTQYILIYKAYGLGYLPLQLIISERSNESIQKEYKNSEAQIREKLVYLQEKKKRKGELSSKEQMKLDSFLAQEK